MIGEMKRRVLFETWGFTPDGFGGNTAAVSSSFQMWAKVDDRNGGVSLFSGQENCTYDYKITVRYNPAVVKNQTILYGGKRLKIFNISLSEEGENKFLILRCAVSDKN